MSKKNMYIDGKKIEITGSVIDFEYAIDHGASGIMIGEKMINKNRITFK